MGEAVAVAARANAVLTRDWKRMVIEILSVCKWVSCEIGKRKLVIQIEWMSFHCSRAVPAPAPGCRSAP
jgi:hypothetical protein